MTRRPSVKDASTLAAVLFAANLVCFLLLKTAEVGAPFAIAALCGFVGALAWWLLPAVTPPLIGVLVSAIPAFFMPDAYLLGLGVLFIACGFITGSLFSVALALRKHG